MILFGSRLRTARKQKKLTQETVSEKLRLSVSFLSKVERGISHFNLQRIFQVCDILDVSIGSILDGTSTSDKNYLDQDFYNLLKSCSPEEKKLIYDVAKTLINNKNK